MSTELSTTPSEVAEPHSLREVLLFCAVLFVEVYSLAVAFGGPFFEVGYFLLVVISQTTAGAYIWAQLRRTDKSLPLPELLAMGFAIGSASAAISQLIIRDLFGIRIFLSPLVPIICVAIWLIAKRNPRLPVTITHANTNTLLWLLFPAPLAMSFFIWTLHLIFIIPLFFYSIVILKTKNNSYLLFIFGIPVIAMIFVLLMHFTHPISVAVGLIGFDEIMDEGFAIGFSNWGLNENIGRTGDSFAYYKLSHVWLAPILELTQSSPMIVSTTAMPLVVFTFIGLSLWATSFHIFRSSSAAGIASVLVFAQNALTEPDNLAIRVAQCLVIVYLLTGLIALKKNWNTDSQESLIVALVFFVLMSTRTQFGVIVLLGFLFHKALLFVRRKLTFRHCVFVIVAIVLSLVSSFLIFFNEPAHAVGAPNQSSEFALIGLLISFVGVRSIIPLLTVKRDKNIQLDFPIVIILSSVLIFFVLSLATLANSPSLTIALLASVLVSNDVSKLQKSLMRMPFISILVSAISFGFLLRLFYDLFKWTDKTNTRTLLKPLVALAVDGKYVAVFTTAPFFALLIVLVLCLRITHRPFNWQPMMLLTALGMSLGISIAATYRSVTVHYRYGTQLAGDIEPDSPMAWYVEAERLDALEWMRKNTERDDIFAQNTSIPDYRTTAYSASLILSGSVRRRAFIEGTYGAALQYDYPRVVFRQTERQRRDLLRLNSSYSFPINPNGTLLKIMQTYNVKWFVVDLANTELRDWEPWATTRFMNEKVAILELNHLSGGDS